MRKRMARPQRTAKKIQKGSTPNMKKLLVIAFLMLALVLTVVACTDDPAKNPDAVKFDEISYDEVLAKHLMVMDSTATSLSMDNHIPIILFALADPENILRVVMGEKIGTLVKEEQ